MLTVDFMNHAPILKSEEIKIQANQIVTVERVWRAFAIENVNSLTHDMYPLLSLRRIPFHLVVGLRAKRTMAQSLRWRARTPNVCTRKFKQIYQRLEIHTYQRHIYQSTTRNRRATMNHQPRLCARARIFVHSHTLSQLQFVAIKCKLRETKTKRNKRYIFIRVFEYMQSIKPPSGNRVWRLAVCLVDFAVVRTRRINHTITAFTLSRIRLTDVVGRCSFTSSPLIKSSLNANTLTHWLIWWQRCKMPRTPGHRGHHRI